MSTPQRFGSRRVLLDSAAFLALVNPRDGNRAAALAIRSRLTAERSHLFTTNFVIAETHALILNRVSHGVAAGFLRQINRGSTTIVRVSARDEHRARAIIEQYDDKDFSLVDAISFAVMERLHIGAAFTFDRHFAQYGFAVLEAM